MEVAQWIATGAIFLGLVVTLVKNGKSQAKEYGALGKKVDDIKDDLTGAREDIKSLDDKIDGIKENCASKTTEFNERLLTNEREIAELRNKK